jgi:tetratricopeptide (TPR) repeat protein
MTASDTRPRGFWEGGIPAALLAAATAAAYAGSFSVPFVYDDTPTIPGNPSLRSWATVLSPPDHSTAAGRPVLNLSFALNELVSGNRVWSYHALNLAIHVAAGLLLYGIVRRTLAGMSCRSAPAVAFSASLLWLLHPLQTEAVTYVVQRAESLMGLLYLLTLYGFIRLSGEGGSNRRLWACVCIGACALGMGTKEVMVTAPVVVWLYDRTFAAGSFAAAIRLRPRLYGALAATWIPLAILVASSHGRGGTAGAGSGIGAWAYALTQVRAVPHYLGLCAWPHPLVFDYGTALALPSAALAAEGVLLAALVGAAAWAVSRRTAAGFLGACFFVILAPSSSFVPVATETMAEHRMYLPLAAVVVMGVSALYRWVGRAALPACLAVAAGLLAATWSRNLDYRSEVSIWRDTVSKRPGNDRAHANLAAALLASPGHVDEALAEYREAVRLNPGDADTLNDLGSLYLRIPGRTGEAVAAYREALRIRPHYFDALNNLGYALSLAPGTLNDAVAAYGEALRLRPSDAGAHSNLGSALLKIPGRAGDAVAEFQEALRLDPTDIDARTGLANALSALPGRLDDAVSQYREVLRLRPDDADVHNNLAYALSRMPGRLGDAEAEFREALRLNPGFEKAHANYGYALSRVHGRSSEAADELQEAVRLDPGDAEARFNLANVWMVLPGHLDEAISQYEAALRLDPANARLNNNLGYALANVPGRLDDAIARYREAIRLNPDYAMAHLNLGFALLAKPELRGEAPEQFREVLRLQPQNEEARRLLSSLGGTVP